MNLISSGKTSLTKVCFPTVSARTLSATKINKKNVTNPDRKWTK